MFQGYIKNFKDILMQVNAPYIIECIYKNTQYTSKISTFKQTSNLIFNGVAVTYADSEYGKPIGFKLIKLNVPVDNLKLIHWLQHDFKDMFDYDPLIWFASVGTMPIKLRQYLIPFYQESKEPKCHILGPSSN